MAIIPASRGVIFYDPDHRLYKTSNQANANLTDMAYTMQDIIDTVNASESVSSETQTVLTSLSGAVYTDEVAQSLSETVNPGDVSIIYPIKSIRGGGSPNNSNNYVDPMPGFEGVGASAYFDKPIIINRSQYTNAQLFGNAVSDTGQFNSDYFTVINLGFVNNGWLLKGLWEVEVNVQYSAWAKNLHDGTSQTPITLMTTMGGGKNNQIDYKASAEDGTTFSDLFQNETIIGSNKFESEYATRDVTKPDGTIFTADADFYTYELSHKQLINNWTWGYMNVQTYANGGSGIGPSGAARLYGGAGSMIVGNVAANPSGFSQFSDLADSVRVNGVTLPNMSVDGNGFVSGGVLDFVANSASPLDQSVSSIPGFVKITWAGPTEGIASYYYYGGDGIGTGNLD